MDAKTKKVDEMWWDGPDLVIKTQEGETYRYTDAVFTKPPEVACESDKDDPRIIHVTLNIPMSRLGFPR